MKDNPIENGYILIQNRTLPTQKHDYGLCGS